VNTLLAILPVLVLLLFILNIFYNGNTVQSCLYFILCMLPFMDMKITKEAWGGFKIFDALCFYCLFFLLKDFTTINLKHRANFYLVLFIALCVVVLLGGLSSEFPDRTYLNLVKIFPIFIFGRFLLTECFRDSSFHIQAIRALKISYLTALAFLAVQVVIGLKFTFYPELSPNTIDPVFHIVRYPGIFYDSQGHGQYLAMGSFLFLYHEPGISKRNRYLNYLIFAIAIIAINLAGSRAAFGGFVIGAVICFFIAAGRYRIIGAIGLIAAGLLFTTLSIRSGVFDRAKNISGDLQFRQSLWAEAYQIAEKHPLLGIGSGNYQNYVIRHNQNQYLEIESGQRVYFDQPENGYLKIMVELGFTGFAIFVLFMITPLVKGFIAAIGYNETRVVFLLASLISWLIAFNSVYSIYDYRIFISVVSMVVLIMTYPETEYDEEDLADEPAYQLNETYEI
jgi:O-antigen ligase